MTEKKKRPWNHRSNPPSPIPENLRTPDGREFSVEELLRQTNRDRQSHNLNTPTIKKYNQTKPNPRSRRYTQQARSWIAHQDDINDIALQLGITEKEARRLQYRMRKSLVNQGLWNRPYC
jgi:hypothetical protein